jgi:hypothetical protein
MLMDANQKKPAHIDISDDQWIQMKQNIRDGILRKIKAVRHMQTIDIDIAAGLYVYAVEEFGKLLLLRKAPLLNGKRNVTYRDEFVYHSPKFREAFNYFQTNGLDACMVLASNFEPNDVVLNDVYIRQLANTEARLSIFYSDFAYDNNQNIIVERPPDVDSYLVPKATGQLETATKQLQI